MATRRVDRIETAKASAARPVKRAGQVTALAAISKVVEWLFLLVIAILPMDAYIFLPGKQSGVFLSEVVTAQACALFVVGYLLARWWRRPFPLAVSPRLLVPLGMVLGASLLSLVFAHARGVALRECAQYAFFVGLFLLAVAVARQPGIRNRAFWAILAGYYVVVIFGLLGTLTNLPDIAQILLNVQRDTATLPGTLTPRAASTFRFPDELNAYLLLVLPFLVACAFTARSRFERAMYGVYALLGLWLLFLTYARSALILVVIITPLLLYLLGGLRVGLVGVALVLLGGLGVVMRDAAIAARGASLLDVHNSGYVYRLQTWQWALNAFAHHPLFGMGPRNLQFWPGAPYADAFRHLREDNGENSYINTLADLGIVGFAALVVCIVAAFRRVGSGLRDRTTWLSRSWHIGFLVGFCALLLDSLVHPTFTSTQVTALLCAFVGLAGPYRAAATETPTLVDRAAALIEAQRLTGAPSWQAAGALRSRVVFLVNARGFGGAEQHSINLATNLHRRGVRVLVVCPPGSPLPEVLARRGVPYQVREVGMPIGRMRGVLGTLNHFLNPLSRSRLEEAICVLAAQEPSIFVCPFPREQLLVTPICQKLGAPVIWGIHSPMLYLPHRLLLRSRWHRRAQQASLVFAVSEEFTWQLAAAGFPAHSLTVMRNAVPGALLAQHRRAPVPGRLVITSRLTKEKGVQYAIEALRRVRASHPNAHLLVAGAGRYEHSLRQLARHLGVAEHVQFLGYQPDALSVLATASIALCPSVEQEVLPTTILEAQGMGIPVVASRIGGIPAIVHDRATGLLVPPGDVTALADALSAVLDNPLLADSLGEQGQRLVREGYTFEHVGEQFVRALGHIERGEIVSVPLSGPISLSEEMRALHRPRLIGNTGLFVAAKVATAFATALWTVLAARTLTSGSYGNLMLAASLAELAAIITDAGVTTVATRDLAAARDGHEVRTLTMALVYLKLALGVVALLVTCAVGFVFPFGPEARMLLIVLSPGLVFTSLNSLTLVFRARMLFPVVLRIAFGVAAINSILAVAAFVLAPTALAFALADLLATVSAGTMTVLLVFQSLRPHGEAYPREGWRKSFTVARSLLLSSLLLGMSMALNIFYVRIDVPLLALLTNSTQVAIYTSAYRVIDVVSLVPVSAAGVALPLMVSLGSQQRERLQAFAQQYLDIAVVCGLFVALVVTLVGHEVIFLLYGGRYAAAEPVLFVLSWAGAAMFVTNVFNPLAVALDHRRTLLLATLLGLVANVGLNLLLIPHLGPIGPAWATLLTEVVVTAPLAAVSLHSLRWRPDFYTIAAALEATGAALLSTIITRDLAGWASVAVAIVIWWLMLAVLAPAWVAALVRSAGRLRGLLSPKGGARTSGGPSGQQREGMWR